MTKPIRRETGGLFYGSICARAAVMAHRNARTSRSSRRQTRPLFRGAQDRAVGIGPSHHCRCSQTSRNGGPRRPAPPTARYRTAARQELSSSWEQKHTLCVTNNAGIPSRFKRRLDPRFYTKPKDAIARAERDKSPSQRTAASVLIRAAYTEKASMAFLNPFKIPTKTFPRADQKIALVDKRVIPPLRQGPRIAGTLHLAGPSRIGGK